MVTSQPILRLFLLFVSMLMLTIFTVSFSQEGLSFSNIFIGTFSGIALGSLIIGLDILLKRCNFKAFNAVLLGIFAGYLMAEAIIVSLSALFYSLSLNLPQETLLVLKGGLFLSTIYIAVCMALRTSDYLSLVIPFIRLPENTSQREILLDTTVLLDSKILDIANSGLLDGMLIIPRFMVKDLYVLSESNDETLKARGKKGLEILKKLESLPLLQLKYSDVDFPKIKDPIFKLIQLAQDLKANIMTGDILKLQQYPLENIRLINIQVLSTAFKSITGEQLNVKIQRYGKEPRQGVGYLEDGTMVVINGGAEFIGETIKAHVLSIKHTTSGRIIFCNANDEGAPLESHLSHSSLALENDPSPRPYFL